MALDIAQFDLLWGDEFTDLSISDSATRDARWYTQQMWGGGFGNAAFMPSTSGVFNIVQKGGESALEIRMRRNAAGNLESGMIGNVFPDGTSEANQTSREGYYEARLWLPDPFPGIWPGFWGIETERLQTTTRDHVIELDVMEHYGAPMPDRFTSSVHDWDWAGTTLQGHSQVFNRKVAGTSTLNTGWHTYGLEIGADGSLTYFFDREAYYYLAGDSSNNGVATYDSMINTPLGWMIDMAAGAGWPIDPNLATATMPVALWVDYFRIYKRVSGQAGMGGSTGGSPPPPPPPPPSPPPPPANPTVSVGNVTVAESGGAANFAIVLSAAQTQIVSVDYATADGTATAGSDYTSVSGTATFNPGDTSFAVSVPIINDTIVEPTESFTLALSNASMALVISAPGTGTITDDDVPPPPPTNTITGTAADETITGTPGADIIYGLGGRDTIYGGDGDDVIIGGPGIDTLFGQGGKDVFKYGPDAEGWTDVIKDFTPGEDKIDLSTLRGTEPFTFIGNAAFTGIRQVRVYSSVYLGVTYTQIEVNVDGSLAADLTISLKNGPTLTAADFIL